MVANVATHVLLHRLEQIYELPRVLRASRANSGH
jgi:hypothetical protein